MKKNRTAVTILSVLLFLGGMGMVAYPYLAEYWNERVRSEAAVNYDTLSEHMTDADEKQMLERAGEYNKALLENGEAGKDYDRQLDVDGRGMMGYVSIPKIHCCLPVFHSTDEAVMQNAVGHLKESSLPIGGESTHSVLSAHRGALSSRLFTDLDQLETGDTFLLKVLNETLVYEIDSIQTVLPEQTDSLAIEKGKDLCTLVTCTPFGINTHRLLVRGHRTDSDEAVSEQKQADMVLPTAVLLLAICLAVGMAARKHSHSSA